MGRRHRDARAGGRRGVLPEERESRFLPFAVGAAGYAVLLIVAA
jgi:hypothetical protein